MEQEEQVSTGNSGAVMLGWIFAIAATFLVFSESAIFENHELIFVGMGLCAAGLLCGAIGKSWWLMGICAYDFFNYWDLYQNLESIDRAFSGFSL